MTENKRTPSSNRALPQNTQKMLQNIPKKRARNRLAIRTLFWAGCRVTESLGFQFVAVRCEAGSVLSHLCRTHAMLLSSHGKLDSLLADLGRPMAETTVGTPSSSHPGRQMCQQREASHCEGNWNTRPARVGKYRRHVSRQDCIVRIVRGLCTNSPSMPNPSHGHKCGTARQCDEPSPGCFLGQAAPE